MTEREFTPEELKDVAGGKQTRQAGEIDGTADKKARPTREGKLTFRRHDGPEN